MAKAKRSGNSHKGYYASYKTAKRWEANRRKKLERALKRNPENEEQIRKAMANISYRRKTPTTPKWTATTRRIAELFKLFQGFVPDVAINGFVPKSKSEDEQYWAKMNAVKKGFLHAQAKYSGSMFSIAARLAA